MATPISAPGKSHLANLGAGIALADSVTGPPPLITREQMLAIQAQIVQMIKAATANAQATGTNTPLGTSDQATPKNAGAGTPLHTSDPKAPLQTVEQGLLQFGGQEAVNSATDAQKQKYVISYDQGVKKALANPDDAKYSAMTDKTHPPGTPDPRIQSVFENSGNLDAYNAATPERKKELELQASFYLAGMDSVYDKSDTSQADAIGASGQLSPAKKAQSDPVYAAGLNVGLGLDDPRHVVQNTNPPGQHDSRLALFLSPDASEADKRKADDYLEGVDEGAREAAKLQFSQPANPIPVPVLAHSHAT